MGTWFMKTDENFGVNDRTLIFPHNIVEVEIKISGGFWTQEVKEGGK